MKARRTLGLAVATTALAGYVLFLERHQISGVERRAMERQVFQVDINQVNRLELRKADYEVGLTLSNGVWRMDHPGGARANGAVVRRMLSRLRGLERGGLITVEDMRNEGRTLADFGLVVPDLEMRLQTPQGLRAYRVGDPNPLGTKLYIKEDSTQNVMLVSMDLLDVLPPNLDAFQEADLFKVALEEVEAVSLVRNGATLRLQKQNGRWWITEPERLPANPAEVEGLLARLIKAKAEGFVNDPAPDQFLGGVEAAESTIRLWSEGDRIPFTMQLGAPVEGAPNRVYARLEGRGGLIEVSAGLKQMTLTPMDRLRDPFLLPTDESWKVASITLTSDGSETRLDRTPNGWRMLSPLDRPADSQRVEALLAAWRQGRVVDFQVGETPQEETHRITFTPVEGSGMEPVEYGVMASDGLPGRTLLRKGDGLWRVTPDVRAVTPMEPRAYLSRKVMSFPVADVVRLNVTRGEQTFEFSREGMVGAWQLVNADAITTPLAENVNNLLRILSSLEADGVDSWSPADQAAALDLDQLAMRLSIGLQGQVPSNKTLLVGPQLPEGGVRVQVLGESPVYRLSTTQALYLQMPLVTETEKTEEEVTGQDEETSGETP